MFNFFNKISPIDDIIKLLDNTYPKIVFCDYNVFINQNSILNEHTSMFKTNLKKFLNNEKTLEFLIFNKLNSVKEMEDGFVINDLIDIIYDQSVFNINFFRENRKDVDRINNIIHINTKQNDFLYKLCFDDFYIKPYSSPLNIYIIFSSVKDCIDFVLRYKITNNIHLIVYNTTFNYLTEYEKQIFEFINNILNTK